MARTILTGAAFDGALSGAAVTSNSVRAHVPLIERPGPPSGRFGSLSSSSRNAVMFGTVGLDPDLGDVLRRRVALREDRAVGKQVVLLSAGNQIFRRRADDVQTGWSLRTLSSQRAIRSDQSG